MMSRKRFPSLSLLDFDLIFLTGIRTFFIRFVIISPDPGNLLCPCQGWWRSVGSFGRQPRTDRHTDRQTQLAYIFRLQLHRLGEIAELRLARVGEGPSGFSGTLTITHR